MTITLPYIDRIWRSEGEVRLPVPMSPEEAFPRLDPLFQTPGTTYHIDDDTLTYKKRNPAAQDKLATFTRGTLRVAQHQDGTARLRFNVSSTALLLCFLAPLLFLALGQTMEAVNAWEKAAEAAAPDDKDKDKDKASPKPELHPLDQWLGAPEPEDPAKKKDEKKDEGKFDPIPAYVLAGLFLAIYLVGRVLEPWLLKRTLRAALTPSAGDSSASVAAEALPFAQPQAEAR